MIKSFKITVFQELIGKNMTASIEDGIMALGLI